VISIPAASPFQSDLLSSQLANSLSSNAFSPSGSSETQSFASYFKKEDETRSTTESTVLKKSATKHTKEPPRPNKPGATSTLLTATGVIAQANDPRSILLSLQQSRNGDGDASSTVAGKTGGGTVAGAAAKTDAPMESGTAPQKSQLAFSVTLPKTDAPAGKPSGTGADFAAGIATANKASLDDKSSAGGRHSGTSDSNDSRSSSKAPAASDNTTNTAAFAPVASAASAASAATGLVIDMAPGQTSPYSGSNSGKIASLPSAAEVMGSADLSPTPVSRPPQSIDLKVEGTDNNQGVDVRISQRAGDVQVTVRTPDNQLADSLRQHLPELSDRLAQNGVDGEIWHPGTAQASGDTASNQESWTSDQSQGQQQQQRSPDGRSRQPQENENGSLNWQNESKNAEKE
jgi:hypothetical protein